MYFFYFTSKITNKILTSGFSKVLHFENFRFHQEMKNFAQEIQVHFIIISSEQKAFKENIFRNRNMFEC